MKLIIGHSAVRLVEGRAPLIVTILALFCLIAATAAQRRFFYRWDQSVRNIPYDGRFTFVRVRYTPSRAGYWAGGLPSWVHGYPLAEQNLMHIMKDCQPARRACRRDQRRHARRSGSLSISDRVHHRGWLVDAYRRRGGRWPARLPAEGRSPDRRRLQGRRLETAC